MESLRKRLERGPLDPHELLRFARALADYAWGEHSQDKPLGRIKPDQVYWDGIRIELKLHLEPKKEDQGAEENSRIPEERDMLAIREDVQEIGSLIFLAGTGELSEEIDLLPSQFRGSLPKDWDGILSNCLHKNPYERFAHAGDILVALSRISPKQWPSPPRQIQPSNKPQKVMLFLIPILLLTLLAVYLLGFEIHGHGRTYDDLVQRGRGESVLNFFESWDRTFLPGKDPEDFSRGDRLYGPFASTLSVWAGKHLAPLIGDPQKELHLPFHTGLTLFGLLWVLSFYIFALRIFKKPTIALASTFILLSLPRVFGQLTSNPSDLPAAAMMTLSALMMFRWFDRPSFMRTLSFAVALAALGATRMQNGGLMAILCLPPILFRYVHGKKNKELPLKQVLLLPVVAYFFFILFWPSFWSSPLLGPVHVLRDFFHHQSRYSQGTLFFGTLQSQAPTYPLVLLALTTPLSILALFFLGIFRKKPSLPHLFLGGWILLSLGKHLTGVANHGGIRHFLDVFVPLSIFAGIGIQRALNLLGVIACRRTVTIGLPILFLSLGLFTHPFESSYFNLLIGGTPGAASKFDLDSNGSSFLVLMKKIRPQLKKGDILLIPGAKDLVVQVPLPKNCLVFPLRPNQNQLIQTAIRANFFSNRRCILLFHQGILWGSLDPLIREEKLQILQQTGPKGLPLSMALLLRNPKDLFEVLKRLKPKD
jgi:hypothetical protein